MGVMFFFRRSSEEQASVFVVGLISQVPLAFWNRATVPDATAALPTWRRYRGEVVPIPTLPLLATYNTLMPDEEAMFNKEAVDVVPCITKADDTVVVPMAALPGIIVFSKYRPNVTVWLPDGTQSDPTHVAYVRLFVPVLPL